MKEVNETDGACSELCKEQGGRVVWIGSRLQPGTARGSPFGPVPHGGAMTEDGEGDTPDGADELEGAESDEHQWEHEYIEDEGDDDDEEEDWFHDHVAREIGCTTMVMWGNLLAVLIDTLAASGLPRELIHDVLDRLDGANEATLSTQGAGIAKGFVQAVREKVPGND